MLIVLMKGIRRRPAFLIGGAVLAVIIVGLSSGWDWMAPEISYAFDGDWRHTTAGLQRIPERSSLAGQRACLVHFHKLDGRAGAVSVLLSAARKAGDARLCVFRNGTAFASSTLGQRPEWVRVPISKGERDIDVGLVATPRQAVAQPLIVDGIVVRRIETPVSLALRILPTIIGVVVLLVLRRRVGLPRAMAWAVVATLGSSAALCVVCDPTALARFRPFVRARFQLCLAASIGFLALIGGKSRWLGLIAIAGIVLTIHLPSIHNGLVNDDFLWARPWTWPEVSSTYHGSEDPLGISNEYYRPLASTSHALDYVIWGMNPQGMHFTNILLAIAAIALLHALLLRAGLPFTASLAGALVVAAHPLTASAVGWMSQRTDIILTINYLATLLVILGPQGAKPARVLPWAALALGSKEIAVTLPIVAAVFCWSALPAVDWRARWKTLRALFYLLLLYIGFWVSLFPEKYFSRLTRPAGVGGVASLSLGELWRWPMSFYAPLFLPQHYDEWWHVHLKDKGALYLIGGTLLGAGLLVFILARRSTSTSHKRLAFVASLWPLAMILPMAVLRGVDIYRLGFLPTMAVGLLFSCAIVGLANRRAILAPLAAVLVAWMAFYAARTSAEWGPGGFYYEQELLFFSVEPERMAGWPEVSRRIFYEQQRFHDHMESPLDDLASEPPTSGCLPTSRVASSP